jgi:hypothetical protein
MSLSEQGCQSLSSLFSLALSAGSGAATSMLSSSCSLWCSYQHAEQLNCSAQQTTTPALMDTYHRSTLLTVIKCNSYQALSSLSSSSLSAGSGAAASSSSSLLSNSSLSPNSSSDFSI